MEWLSSNALFRDRLCGTKPCIDKEKAKARLFKRIHDSSPSLPLQRNVKSTLLVNYMDSDKSVYNVAEVE